MNLKPKCKPSWHLFFSKNFIAIYIAFALVLIINQIIFSIVLKNREDAKAFNSSWGAAMMTNLGDSTVNAGTTNALLAEFWLPDALFGNVTCDWSLAGNPCIVMIDADGTASVGAGADDDGIQYFFDLPTNGIFQNSFFTASDGVCTDSLTAPTCIYIDLTDGTSCTDGVTGDSYILGAGCAAVTDLSVQGATLPLWVHSEAVNANATYDYGATSATTETIWIFAVNADTPLVGDLPDINQSGIWQNDAAPAWNPIGVGNLNGEGYIDSAALGYFDGNLPVIIDADGDTKYADSPDTLLDADGTGSVGIGTDDDGLAVGTPFTQIKLAENVCINNFSYGSALPSTIIYVDGSGDCVPGNGGTDALIRDDIGGPLVYTGSFPYTFFNAATLLVYADSDSNGVWTYGAGAAASESLWLEDQGHNYFNLNSDTMIDGDGTEGLGGGDDDDNIAQGTPMEFIKASDNICGALIYPPFGSDVRAVMEDLYQDGNGDCIPGNGGVDIITMDENSDGLNAASIWGGVWSSFAAIASYYDSISDGVYTIGASSAATESLWLTSWLAPFFQPYPSYSPSGDSVIFNSGSGEYAGDNLIDFSTANGPTGFPVKFIDIGASGGLTNHDVIYEDNGNISTGPGAMPNGVIDRLDERVNMMTVKNLGTLSNTSITSLKLYIDAGSFFSTNGRCDNPVGSIDDFYVGDFTFDASSNQWLANFAGSILSHVVRGCLAADIARGTLGGTIIASLPALIDANSNGLYEAGDSGEFYYSQNDGPIGGAITAPYTITVNSSSVAGSGSGAPSDTVAPSMPININITASAAGNVNITWTDPVDADLSQILVEEYLGNSASSNIVAKGVQNLSLAGRQIGSEYKYSIRAMDTAGNYSPQILYSVIIPASGEITVTQPVYSPAPITPVVPITPGTGGLILQDPEPAQALPPSVQVGTLVKMTGLSSVYFIDQDNRRHPFPNEATYFSWFPDFSGVQTIPAATLSAIPLGSNVTMRPGTYLIKIQTDPKVYAVEPYGVLRWVSSETIANKLYGSAWSKRIIDVNDSFFTNYQVGSDITSVIHPTGSVMSYTGESATYFIENGVKRYLTSEAFTGDKFRNEFVIRNVGTDLVYTTGENYPLLPMETLMTLR